jgi:small subunit ribosomal protein S20
MRSAVREVEEAIAAGDKTAAVEALKQAQPQIMRAAARGLVHGNAASRKISRLSQGVAKLS